MKPIITSAQEQTKKWRKEQNWYTNGKRTECEKYQKSIIENLTGFPLNNTNLRLNTETTELLDYRTPLVQINGFEWTENFDGIQLITNQTLLYNLKMICDDGGAQTRSLREVYLFIKVQIFYLDLSNKINLS